MTRENLVLVSCRIDPETLKKIEAQLIKHTYWKRNTIINSVLTAVFDNFTDQQIYDMVRYWRKAGYQTKAEFEIIRDQM